jgi:hypothetical protein
MAIARNSVPILPSTSLLSIFFMRFCGQQLSQPRPEGARLEPALQAAAVAQRNGACFLADHDNDGVGFLGESKGRAMTHPKIAVNVGPVGDGENAGGCQDTVITQNQPAIMQWGSWVKDRNHQFT